MKKNLYILVTLAILTVAFLWYLGIFSKYEIKKQGMGPYTMAYAEHIGPYTKVGPVMDQIYNDLVEKDINSTMGYGRYFSNPKITPKEDLRSEVGSIIKEEDILKLDRTGEKYKVRTLPKANYLVVEFPYKNMLSFMIGPMKIYPIMEKYMLENDIEWSNDMPSMEIYDMENKTIIYLVNI
ncbi:GyrI-like domain-containing protein [Patescibacteria group bacterium]|nr:GyrI-like domain-containing protein [Patescibacteria group bacterium]